MAWLDKLAAHARVGRSAAVEHGLILLAEQVHFGLPAPKR
jgi:hypothetical protein